MRNCPVRRTGSRRAVIRETERTAAAHLGKVKKRRRDMTKATCVRVMSRRISKSVNMAYMNQERKAQLSPAIKAHCRKYGMKATIAVRHHSTLVVNIKSGKLPLVDNYYDTVLPEFAHRYPLHDQPKRQNYVDVNPYHAGDHFTGKCRTFILELLRLMNIGNHDNSDPMTDYFDVGWYKDVNIGSWKKPYQVIQ